MTSIFSVRAACRKSRCGISLDALVAAVPRRAVRELHPVQARSSHLIAHRFADCVQRQRLLRGGSILAPSPPRQSLRSRKSCRPNKASAFPAGLRPASQVQNQGTRPDLGIPTSTLAKSSPLWPARQTDSRAGLWPASSPKVIMSMSARRAALGICQRRDDARDEQSPRSWATSPRALGFSRCPERRNGFCVSLDHVRMMPSPIGRRAHAFQIRRLLTITRPSTEIFCGLYRSAQTATRTRPRPSAPRRYWTSAVSCEIVGDARPGAAAQ